MGHTGWVPWPSLKDAPLHPKVIFRCHILSPGPSLTRVSSTQRCSHDEDTPALEKLTLRETQLAPRRKVWPNLGTWGHPPQLRLTPHELSFVLQAPQMGDTHPAKQGVSPAIPGGCSRHEGSARTWHGW